ncbi:MAG: hypothetical protein MHMPM18_004021 [Marteilia pararefringens]
MPALIGISKCFTGKCLFKSTVDVSKEEKLSTSTKNKTHNVFYFASNSVKTQTVENFLSKNGIRTKICDEKDIEKLFKDDDYDSITSNIGCTNETQIS